jgi:pilus assembly protein Flp/PilA
MFTLIHCLKSFRDNESGATAIEYALIAGIIGVGIVTSLITLKGALNTSLTTTADQFK